MIPSRCRAGSRGRLENLDLDRSLGARQAGQPARSRLQFAELFQRLALLIPGSAVRFSAPLRMRIGSLPQMPEWHSALISMPARSAASQIVSPGATWTVLPAGLNETSRPPSAGAGSLLSVVAAGGRLAALVEGLVRPQAEGELLLADADLVAVLEPLGGAHAEVGAVDALQVFDPQAAVVGGEGQVATR